MLLVFFASGAVQGIWLYTVKVVENQAHSLYSKYHKPHQIQSFKTVALSVVLNTKM